MDGRIELKPHAVCQTAQIVEDTHDVGHFEKPFVVETELTQGFPVLLHHSGWLSRKLLGHSQQHSLAVAKVREFSPPALLYGLRQLRSPAFSPQKLCVTLSSVEAILGGGRRKSNQFPLLPREDAVGREHNLRIQLRESGTDPWM